MNLTINLTRKCNKRCDFCYLRKGEEEIDLKRLQVVINKTEPQIITLTGGEPFLYSRMNKLMKSLDQRGCHVRIFSNGRLPAKHILNVLSITTAELFISYNDHDKTVLKNLELLDKNGVDICINHYFKHRSKADHRRLLSEIGFIKRINYLYPLRTGAANIKMCSPAEWFQRLEIVRPLINDIGIKGFYETSFIKAGEPISKVEKLYPCRTGLFLDTDGLMYPCCFMTDHSKGRTVPSPGFSPFKCEILKKHRSADPSYRRICPLILSIL